jgi:N-methylhydantoinase A
VVPLSDLASGWSAFGIAASDAVVVEEIAKAMTYPFDTAVMNDLWAALEAKVRGAMRQQGIEDDQLEWERQADIRYSQQINQLAVVARGGSYDEHVATALVESFEREYERLFGKDSGYADAGFALTAMRVRARARVSEFALAPQARSDGGGVDGVEPKGERNVIWYEHGLEPERTPIFNGDEFRSGSTVDGPTIIEYADTTLVLRRGDRATVDSFGSVVIDLT